MLISIYYYFRYLHNNNEINELNNESLKYVSYVTLQRQECGFGFRIVGGKEEGSQVIYIYIYVFLKLYKLFKHFQSQFTLYFS